MNTRPNPGFGTMTAPGGHALVARDLVARLALPLALAALVAAGVSGCRGRHDSEGDAQHDVPEEAVVAITGRCAEPLLIGNATDESEIASGIAGATDADRGSWGPVTIESSEPCFRMHAQSVDATGVFTDTAFVFESAVDIEPEHLAQLLRSQPPTGLEIESQTAEGSLEYSYLVSPVVELDEGQLYRFTLSDVPTYGRAGEASAGSNGSAADDGETESAQGGDAGYEAGAVSGEATTLAEWGFQTREQLRVVQTLPGNATLDVPLDAGIELTFSHADVGGVEERFSIEPHVDGAFEPHRRTVVFVPEGLEPRTLYTVRLAPGVSVGSGLEMTKPYEFRFETGDDEREALSGGEVQRAAFTRLMWEQPTGQPPVMSLLSFGPPDELAGEDAELRALRYPSLDVLLADLEERAAIPDWARYSSTDYVVDASELEPVAEADVTLEPLGEFGELLIRFPAALDEGAYLIELTIDGETSQAWLQVTDVATYVALTASDMIVWVNDAATGDELPGAEVVTWPATGDAPPDVDAADATGAGTTAGDSGSAAVAPLTTDGDGIAFAASPPELLRRETHPWGDSTYPQHGLTVTAPDGRSALVPLSNIFRGLSAPGYREFYAPGHPLYWAYLYLDRGLYRQSDTIRFWGVARPRDESEPLSAVTVELTGNDYLTSRYEQAVVARTEVPVSVSGTFIGELPYSGATPGYYTLRSSVDGDVLSQSTVEIGDIVKPAYQLTMSPEVEAVFLGDTITMAVQASFFEGSHVPGMELLVETDAGALPAVTDDSGRAVVAYTASTDPSRSSGYGQSWAAVRPARPEEGEITASASTLVFPAELALDLTSDVEGGIGRITGTVRLVDLSAPGAVEPQDYLGAPVAGRQVTAAITEVHYERVETGEFYDFVDKVVRKSYLYETVEEPGGEIRAVSDESGAFELLVPLASDISYTVDLSVADDGGRGTERTVYLSAGPGGIPSWETSWVTEHQDPYAEGDTVELTLERGGEPMPDGDRYLFLRARSGIRDYEVSTTPVISFVFGPDDVPNTHILGVSFNGATFSEAPWSYNARLDPATRELAIEVTTDRERYAPGDEVSVAVSTHGPDGEPVSAEVLLSGIDAAIRQMQADEPGTRFLDDLYASVAPGVVRTYSSHYYPIGQPGAEYGGGGDGARGWFEDVALFESVTTDASGRAETSFVVPDNLTSWVISALGLDEVMQAGYGVGEAPVGLPLFVDLTANDTYLASDEPVLRLRAYGEALDTDDEVSFELYSETLMDEPLAVSGPANTGVEIPLSTEIGGEHVIAALATNGELEDVLERTITVLPSRLASAASSSAIVGVGEQYEPRPAGSRVSLTVSDANRGRYLPELALLATSQGDRLDQMVARLTAAELQRDQFPAVGSGDEQATAAAVASGGLSAVTAGSAAPPLQPYRTPDRGLALLPYGDADLRVSARVAAVAPAEAGRQGLVEYFTRVVDDDGETLGRVAEALHGLAALGEPVLPSVVSLLDAEGLEPRDALLLGIAAADLGDYDSAQRVYTELLAGHGQRRGATMRLNVDGDRDEVAEATALAAVLGAALGDDAAPRLHDYSAIASTTDYVPDLDNVDYLARALPRTASAPLEVAYTHLGERSSSDIGADQSLTLSLTPTELAELALEVVGGRAAVVATELVPLDVDQLDVDPAIGLSRSYSVEGEAQDAQGAPGGGAEDDTPGTSAIAASDAEPLVIGAGDLVRVTLDYELGEGAVEGCYQISDLLPSGLRAVSRPSGPYGYYDDGDIVYPYAVDGQRVSFCVHRDDRRSDLSYLARVVTTGRYAAEPAVISAMEAPESRAVSTASAIVIR